MLYALVGGFLECPVILSSVLNPHLDLAQHTVKRYSIARSPLKKAARIAKSIWERSNPIDSISAICAALSEPIESPPLDTAGAAAGAGVSEIDVAP